MGPVTDLTLRQFKQKASQRKRLRWVFEPGGERESDESELGSRHHAAAAGICRQVGEGLVQHMFGALCALPALRRHAQMFAKFAHRGDAFGPHKMADFSVGYIVAKTYVHD